MQPTLFDHPRKVTLPSTSIEAYRSVSEEMKANHHAKILKALEQGEANYEVIALRAGMSDKNQCSRRLKELLLIGKIEKTGTTSLTSSGRRSNNYRLK